MSDTSASNDASVRTGPARSGSPGPRLAARVSDRSREEQYRTADILRRARQRRFTQADAADKLRETIADMRDWESGDRPIPRAVRARMAAFYGVDPALINADREPVLSAEEWDLVLDSRARRAEAERFSAPPTDPLSPRVDLHRAGGRHG